MAGLTVVDGRTVRPTATAFAPGPKDRVHTRGAGITGLKFRAFIRGPAARRTRDNGKMESVMVWGWRHVAGGYTEVNGLKGLRDDTAFASPLHPPPGTRVPGPADFTTVTDPKRTRTAEPIRANGSGECDTVTE
ncbi:uncharacterized protein LOC124411587 [Diprion similis]|uniref:uncharacterized protein LOC124411587 n=1 Tax=Diprion similis TaxID=362088 RepID=UPI001EF84031|nr:uncharacterized protein LOC124411587 [Diprion similis]